MAGAGCGRPGGRNRAVADGTAAPMSRCRPSVTCRAVRRPRLCLLSSWRADGCRTARLPPFPLAFAVSELVIWSLPGLIICHERPGGVTAGSLPSA
jgi:hypothetical protein